MLHAANNILENNCFGPEKTGKPGKIREFVLANAQQACNGAKTLEQKPCVLRCFTLKVCLLVVLDYSY